MTDFETEYIPLSIDDDENQPHYDNTGDEMKTVRGFVKYLYHGCQNRSQYFWLQTGLWMKAAATLCIMFVVLKDSGSSTTENVVNPTLSMAYQSATIDITPTGNPVKVWSSIDSLHRCQQIDVPDIPTRAFRDHQERIHMIQGSTNYHNMTGTSLFDVTRDCPAIWNKTANPNPSMFAANEFLDSPFVFDNGTVVVLVHTEFPGDRYDACGDGPAYPYCWTVSIGLMVSHDWGATWKHALEPPHHLIAAAPYPYNPKQLAYGWGDPTNILHNPKDEYYYFAAWNRHTVGLQSAGVCVMRTKNLMDPTSWRGWNGKDFVVSFVSPYNHTDKKFDPANHVCTVLDVDSSILDPTKCNPFGLVYSKPSDQFLMTWACMDGHGAFYMTASDDLIHWSAPQSFYDKTLLDEATKHNVTSLHYPNLMDATAPDQFGDNNYGIIGENPHLFWVSIGHSPYVDGRSAWATPLEIRREEEVAAGQ